MATHIVSRGISHTAARENLLLKHFILRFPTNFRVAELIAVLCLITRAGKVNLRNDNNAFLRVKIESV